MRAISRQTKVPRITAVFLDTPGGTSQNNSKTEQYALKSVEACEWLQALGQAFESPTDTEQKLIT